MKEELKGIENINYIKYDVYKTTTGLYLNEEMCEKYGVGTKEDYKDIKGRKCFKVFESDIQTIQTTDNYQSFQLQPNYITIFDLQLVISFTVYVDINHNNKLYVSNSICNKYGIISHSKRIIKGNTYCNVTEEDIKKIEETTKHEEVLYKKNLVEIELDDEVSPAENLFMYYYDLENKKIYVHRDIYELAKKNEIEIEAKPKIIENKNCYSITEEELKFLETKTKYRGIEKLLKPNPVEPLVNEKLDIKSKVEKIEIPKLENKIETIIVYKDKLTNKLYIPIEYANNKEGEQRLILHKDCIETTISDLEQIYNKRIIITSVFLAEAKNIDIIICNNQGTLFVSQKVLDLLGFYIEKPHRILVQQEIYQEISNEDIEIIKQKESNKLHLNIILKHITPSKKRS